MNSAKETMSNRNIKPELPTLPERNINDAREQTRRYTTSVMLPHLRGQQQQHVPLNLFFAKSSSPASLVISKPSFFIAVATTILARVSVRASLLVVVFVGGLLWGGAPSVSSFWPRPR